MDLQEMAVELRSLATRVEHLEPTDDQMESLEGAIEELAQEVSDIEGPGDEEDEEEDDEAA